MDLEEVSKYMALLLRHKPEKGNIVLDKEGYTSVESLLAALKIDRTTLDTIVQNDKKGRYSYDSTNTKIRANQGHSVPYVEIKFKEYIPTGTLYHGTAKKYLASILKKGLMSQTRQYVHLSQDIDIAVNVGMRHAKSKVNLVIFEIDYKKMIKDGYKFFISENNVVLTEKVPKKYLKRIQ